MTSKNYLSDKKNVKMSFSTSNSLTDWIKRYVNVQKQKNPNDDRYKSVSSFIHYCLEYLMKIFEKEKNLNDFNRFVDQTVENFYDQITFRAIIPQFEDAIEMNRYINLSKGLVSFYSAFRKSFMEGVSFQNNLDNFDKYADIIVERIENFLKQNNITKSMTIEKYQDIFIVEFIGNYKNLHYELCKAVAAISGVAGFKIRDASYIADSSINYFYMRFDIEPTELLKQNKPRLREQIALGNENISAMIKYEHVINDKTEHVWLNTSPFKGAIISFKDIQTGIEYVKSKIEELKKTLERNELSYYILRIFEHFHWIMIDNDDPLSFHFIISKEYHEIEHAIMEEILPEIIEKELKSKKQVIIK